MKIMILNKMFPENPEYSRIIHNASFVPRIGEKIDVGYRPFPMVTDVIWKFVEMEVLVVVE